MIDDISKLKDHPFIRNIKYETIGQVLELGMMKDSQRGWIPAVIYKGEDRYNKELSVFCKDINDFCNEFEIVR